ncbi:cell wall protein DAN4-like [Acyrthosiphon pisum]|uniref:Uncharacterized protein n=1 Tax=Acyrthosiphon pisum TaxID=7029 RepID=A0A8R2NT45_ACYPI|nr:cell wall protein DAN4-like [Acyrthosiphon pisum]|eukprot:XP_003246513.1 PREDICTED: cell wall protein DAN4-like [Acyrthosiphon pisum]
MAEFNVFAIYMLPIFVISLLGSTSIADPVQRDETMTIVLDLNDNPENEIKYIHDNVDLTDWPNVESSMNLIKNDSFAATPEGTTISNATETPSEPTKNDQATKSITKTMTTNTRTTTTMTNSTTATSTSTPTSMSSTTTSSVTISTTSTMSGTRN